MKRSRYNHLLVFVALFSVLIGTAAATVDTRLVYVSNTYNTPSAGQGTLVLRVEAINNLTSDQRVSHFYDAFVLGENLRLACPAAGNVTFSSQFFAYTTVETYNPSTGVISYQYDKGAGPFHDLPAGTSSIVTITIVYNMSSVHSAVSWTVAADYSVLDNKSASVAGSEQSIPAQLQDVTLPVELTVFTASIDEKNQIVLEWSTESEIDNIGFNIYRSRTESGVYRKINNTLIPGAGTTSQRTDYTYIDEQATPEQMWFYRLECLDVNGAGKRYEPVGLAGVARAIPDAYALRQNYPNPFNPTTSIEFALPTEERISIKIYTLLGRQVAVLADGLYSAGIHQIAWNAGRLADGVYLYVLQAGNYQETRKAILLR